MFSITNQCINENLNGKIKRILGAEEAVGLNLNKHKTHQCQILPHNVAMYIYEPAQKKKKEIQVHELRYRRRIFKLMIADISSVG